ncbi:MAG: hypothetical protein JWO57_3961 [Pseudonocardiales bacterium]|nr:hypothetical protein [Pseudonocardiales bacterium]
MAVYASSDAIRTRAARLDPVKVLITVLSVLPYLVFGFARVVWFVLSLLIAAGMEGWDAAGRSIDTRRTEARGG